MKQRFLTILISLLSLLFTGCQEQVRAIVGTYSYKISGQVTVDDETKALPEEIGAMDLLRVDATNAILTFNALKGPVYTAEAEINNNEIDLFTFERNITIGLNDYHIFVTGTGTVHDNTIIFTLDYTGNDISSDQVTLLCKKN